MPSCQFWTWDKKDFGCNLKGSKGSEAVKEGAISGGKDVNEETCDCATKNVSKEDITKFFNTADKNKDGQMTMIEACEATKPPVDKDTGGIGGCTPELMKALQETLFKDADESVSLAEYLEWNGL